MLLLMTLNRGYLVIWLSVGYLSLRSNGDAEAARLIELGNIS